MPRQRLVRIQRVAIVPRTTSHKLCAAFIPPFVAGYAPRAGEIFPEAYCYKGPLTVCGSGKLSQLFMSSPPQAITATRLFVQFPVPINQ